MAFDSVQTPAGKADKVLGGSVNYFSVAASFYAPVQILGVVGEDFPKEHLKWLADRRIDTSGVEVVPGKTFHWAGSYNENMNEAKTISTALNVFEKFDPRLSDLHKNAEYVFLANIDPVLQTSVLDQVKNPRLIAADSMNFWITSKLSELKKTLERVDIISINETEATMLTGEKNLNHAVTAIRKMGPSVIVVKRGEYGAMLFTPRSIFLAPAYPVDRVIDPTGAGDSFAGAFVGFLAEQGADRKMSREDPVAYDRILRRAVLAGCTMASFTVQDFSLHRLMKLEVKELVERQRELMQMIALD